MVLTTPLLRTLAERGPVDVVVTAAAAPLLRGHPAVREVIVFDKRGADRGLGGIRRLAKRLQQLPSGAPRHIATAYFAQKSLRSAVLPVLAGIPRRVGWADSSPGRLFYTDRVPYDTAKHHAERCWALAFPGGVPAGTTMPAPLLVPGDAERAAAGAVLAGGTGRPWVALSPGSVWGTKRWPYYAELARALSERADLVVIGGPSERELAAQVVAAVPAGRVVVDGTSGLSLLASAEVIRRAAVLVTNDSAPLHLASAVGTPSVAIFGPTVPAFGFGPLSAGSVIVEHESMPCRPCHHHGPPECPLGHFKCMREIGVERVVEVVGRVLAM